MSTKYDHFALHFPKTGIQKEVIKESFQELTKTES